MQKEIGNWVDIHALQLGSPSLGDLHSSLTPCFKLPHGSVVGECPEPALHLVHNILERVYGHWRPREWNDYPRILPTPQVFAASAIVTLQSAKVFLLVSPSFQFASEQAMEEMRLVSLIDPLKPFVFVGVEGPSIWLLQSRERRGSHR